MIIIPINYVYISSKMLAFWNTNCGKQGGKGFTYIRPTRPQCAHPRYNQKFQLYANEKNLVHQSIESTTLSINRNSWIVFFFFWETSTLNIIAPCWTMGVNKLFEWWIFFLHCEKRVVITILFMQTQKGVCENVY